MTRDFYEVLGVAPTSEDVVIRAAYRALMRRYHPDTDPSAETTDRAREINAAYAVLSDPLKRARYDGSLAAAGLIKVPAEPRRALTMPAIPRPGPAALTAFALLAALLAMIAISPPLAEMPGAPAILGTQGQRTAAAADVRAERTASPDAAQACDAQAAQDSLKAELFGKAARLGGRQPGAFAAVADRSLVRLQAEPAGKPGGGTLRCDGWLALDLPPGLVVDGGRSNLNSELHYALVPSTDGHLRVDSLAGTEALVASLATLSRAREQPDVDLAPPPEAVAAPVVEAPAPPPSPAPRLRESLARSLAVPKPRPAKAVAGAVPTSPPREASFNCRYASGRAQKAVCGSSNLAALDKHLALLYSQSLGRADEARKAALVTSDASFGSRRDACRSEKCLTAAYVARMREVSEIMARKAQP